jgi:cytidylate kinase
MAEATPYAVTVSCQLGSGGAHIGRQLAARLGVLFVDCETIGLVSQQFNLGQEALPSRDEAVISFWLSLTASLREPLAHNPDSCRAQPMGAADDTPDQSVVIVGSGGAHVLQQYARHVSVFLHANREFRQRRVESLFDLAPDEASHAIERSDRRRGRFNYVSTGREWTHAPQYHLCLDTGVTGLTTAVNLISALVSERFGLA